MSRFQRVQRVRTAREAGGKSSNDRFMLVFTDAPQGARHGSRAASLATGVLLAGPLATGVARRRRPRSSSTPPAMRRHFIDGNCDTAPPPGCSARCVRAIQEANSNAGPDTIKFALATPVPCHAERHGPAARSPVPCSSTGRRCRLQPVGGVIVRVDGVSNTTGLQNGHRRPVRWRGKTIKGLEIDRFSAAGIRLQCDNNVVSGNYIGTTAGSLVNCCRRCRCSDNVGVLISDGSNNVDRRHDAARSQRHLEQASYGVCTLRTRCAVDGDRQR